MSKYIQLEPFGEKTDVAIHAIKGDKTLSFGFGKFNPTHPDIRHHLDV